ncbi:hypothetical protein D3C86_2122040 [compost metagenome]
MPVGIDRTVGIAVTRAAQALHAYLDFEVPAFFHADNDSGFELFAQAHDRLPILAAARTMARRVAANGSA